MPPVISPLRTPPSRLRGAVIINILMPLSPRTTPTATDYLFSTYLGGNSLRLRHRSLRCLPPVGAIVTSTLPAAPDHINFPTRNPIQPSLSSVQHDAFVARIDVTTGALLFSTYLGGTGLDDATAIATDRRGNAYVAGYTQSTNFPTRNAYQPNIAGGGQDAFVAKFGLFGGSWR